MNTLQSELGLVKNRFPDLKLVIEDLYRRDNDFKSLCADLFLCTRMIHDFEAEIIEKQIAINEYRDVIKELEKELQTYIKAIHI